MEQLLKNGKGEFIPNIENMKYLAGQVDSLIADKKKLDKAMLVLNWLDGRMEGDSNIWIAIRAHVGSREWAKMMGEAIEK